MDFELLGAIAGVTPIAIRHRIRDLARLRRLYGAGRWRKMKGIGTVRLPDGTVQQAELHWYEAHGIGRFEMKLKHLL